MVSTCRENDADRRRIFYCWWTRRLCSAATWRFCFSNWSITIVSRPPIFLCCFSGRPELNRSFEIVFLHILIPSNLKKKKRTMKNLLILVKDSLCQSSWSWLRKLNSKHTMNVFNLPFLLDMQIIWRFTALTLMFHTDCDDIQSLKWVVAVTYSECDV